MMEESEKIKGPEERERRRAVNPKMAAVKQHVMSVNYLCYIILCKTFCGINCDFVM